MKEATKSEYILFSDIHARAMQDPEFRRLYEAEEEKEQKILAKMEAKIAAKLAKEAKGAHKAQQPETALI